jgi:peptidoglycan hydrolase CwlO-like protein
MEFLNLLKKANPALILSVVIVFITCTNLLINFNVIPTSEYVAKACDNTLNKSNRYTDTRINDLKNLIEISNKNIDKATNEIEKTRNEIVLTRLEIANSKNK